MKASVDRQKVLLILNWCVKKFGKSRYQKKLPRLFVYKTRGTSRYEDRIAGLRGSYSNGRIKIYLGSIYSYKELCETLIHEYCHYMQSEFEFSVFYNRLKRDGHIVDTIYDIHPHEKKANRFEKRYGIQCFNELKAKLYKKN